MARSDLSDCYERSSGSTRLTRVRLTRMQSVKCMAICINNLRRFKTRAANFFLSPYLLSFIELSMTCVSHDLMEVDLYTSLPSGVPVSG